MSEKETCPRCGGNTVNQFGIVRCANRVSCKWVETPKVETGEVKAVPNPPVMQECRVLVVARLGDAERSIQVTREQGIYPDELLNDRIREVMTPSEFELLLNAYFRYGWKMQAPIVPGLVVFVRSKQVQVTNQMNVSIPEGMTGEEFFKGVNEVIRSNTQAQEGT